MKEVLLTFVGTNDSYKDKDGAVLTVFKKRKFDEVHLLWNPSSFMNYYQVAEYVKSEIVQRKFCKKVSIHIFNCDDVTDHNEIYPLLLNFCKSLKLKDSIVTAAIASGTPSMQACWILIAESGDYPLKLIRSDEAKFGKPIVRDVKLGVSLPRIVRLKEENEELKRERKNLLPPLVLNISKASINIGRLDPELSPVEFSYYRYFIERAFKEEEYLRIDIDTVPEEFYKAILKFHKDSFPQADSNRLFSEKNKYISSATFRANISKLNKKIKLIFESEAISMNYLIESEGKRFSKAYGVSIPKDKIRIIK